MQCYRLEVGRRDGVPPKHIVGAIASERRSAVRPRGHVKALFVDTAGWMALADGNDPHHSGAREALDSWLNTGGLLISSDYVLDGTLTLIRLRLGLPAASHWWDQVSASHRLRWKWMNADRAKQARRWFFQWQDRRFSFTDCSSFVIMRERHELACAPNSPRRRR